VSPVRYGLKCPHSVFMCSVLFSSLCVSLNNTEWLVSAVEAHYVFCEVDTVLGSCRVFLPSLLTVSFLDLKGP
jgi:hypothetical protein